MTSVSSQGAAHGPAHQSGGIGVTRGAEPDEFGFRVVHHSLPRTDGPGKVTGKATFTGDITRTDLLGGWTVASGSESCQLFMTLTSWTGGYRASTRGCTSDTLKSISAWNLTGKQVVLAGSAGKPVASLIASDMNHFNGQLDGQGQAITFYR